MRACEGCRRRKIKCDAATTNTWPCGACIRLKLHCVRPNSQYDAGSTDTTPTSYEPPRTQYDAFPLHDTFRQPVAMPQHDLMSAPKSTATNIYAAPNYTSNPSIYQHVSYVDTATAQPRMHYTTIPPQVTVPDQATYGQAHMFPAPPPLAQQQALPQASQNAPESPPDSFQAEQYSHGDLSDLLGSLNVDEAGTGMWRETMP